MPDAIKLNYTRIDVLKYINDAMNMLRMYGNVHIFNQDCSCKYYLVEKSDVRPPYWSNFRYMILIQSWSTNLNEQQYLT